MELVKSAAAGVYLHGYAGDLGVIGQGKAGLVAGDLIEYLPKVFKEMEG